MPTTRTAVVSVSDGDGPVPSSPSPGLARVGASTAPAASPTAAAASASATFSASNTAPTKAGVPPTAFSSPTRRVCSAMRPPTSTAMLATESIASSQVASRRTFWSSAITR